MHYVPMPGFVITKFSNYCIIYTRFFERLLRVLLVVGWSAK